mmetsp:Transcript_26917/g.71076  ORF Transcript_26917/g.71076 Transcript_26917/m.71076 type:complete len:200 (-) Transcript_26917:353-952(-)
MLWGYRLTPVTIRCASHPMAVQKVLEVLVQVRQLRPEDAAGLLERLLASLLLVVQPLDARKEHVEGLVREATPGLAEEQLAVNGPSRPTGGDRLERRRRLLHGRLGKLLPRWRRVARPVAQLGRRERRRTPQVLLAHQEPRVPVLGLLLGVVLDRGKDGLLQVLKPSDLLPEVRHGLEQLLVLLGELLGALVALHELHL